MKKSCREYSRVRYRKDLWPYTGKNSRQGDLIRGRSRENHRAVESYRKSLWNMTMKLLLKPSASPIGTSIGVLLIKIPIRSEESGAKSRGLALQPSPKHPVLSKRLLWVLISRLVDPCNFNRIQYYMMLLYCISIMNYIVLVSSKNRIT